MFVRTLWPAAALCAALLVPACSPRTMVGPDSADAAADAAGDAPDPQAVTYWRHIAPLLEARCTNCHTEQGIAPMALTTYEQARPLARLLALEAAERRMPPWPPASEGCRPLQNARTLTAEQIDLLARWAEAGAPEGDRADYVPPPPPRPGTVLPPMGELIVQPETEYTPRADQVDDYHCFVMDPGLTDTRDVIGLRVTPGNPRIVHHMILFEVREESLGELQALDDAEPGPGYTCFGDHGIRPRYRAAPAGSPDLAEFNTQMVGAWAPGGEPGYFPPNTGIRLKANSRLVMQVHYNLSSAANRGMSDRTRVDLYLSPRGVAAQALWIPIAQTAFRVPAGAGPDDPAATVTAQMPAQFPLRVFGAAPHMHLRGHSIRVDVAHADGTGECLVNIPRWDFHWQQSYWFNTPFRPITATTGRDVYNLTCVYDNRPENQPVVDGMRQPPRDLTWGEGTNDEMCLNFFYSAL